MVNKGKIVIVGISNVGTSVLNKITDFQLASEVALIDINTDKAEGETLDTSHATASIYSPNIHVHLGTYEDCKDAGIIIIAAGPSIKKGETPDRLILAKSNAKIMNSIMTEVTKYTKEAMLIVITNPLDVATYYISTHFDYPREKIVGTGTMLETYRFRRVLGDHYHVDPKNVHGYVLGEHGNSGFTAWSTVDVAGMSIDAFDDYFNLPQKTDRQAIDNQVVQLVYDVINLKGWTNTGIAGVTTRFIKAVLYDEHTIVPCSAVLEGEYGLRDVALSIPRMLAADGVVKSFEIKLTPHEQEQLSASAASVGKAIQSIG